MIRSDGSSVRQCQHCGLSQRIYHTARIELTYTQFSAITHQSCRQLLLLNKMYVFIRDSSMIINVQLEVYVPFYFHNLHFCRFHTVFLLFCDICHFRRTLENIKRLCKSIKQNLLSVTHVMPLSMPIKLSANILSHYDEHSVTPSIS